MLFSVIVPIYKIESYLQRCIDSVLEQSCQDFELILVDDGSPDGCPQICDACAAEHANVRVVHKKNGGLVSARQAGIQIAAGEYVINLDGDDALLPGALERAKEILDRTHADIVAFPHKEYYPDGTTREVVSRVVPVGLYKREEMERHVYPHILSDRNMDHLFYFLWGKAIRRTLVMPHQLRVSTTVSLGEDISCMVPCYLEADSFYMDDMPFCLYTMRNDSLSTSFNTKQITQIAEVIDAFADIAGKKPADFEDQVARYSCFMCFAILAAAAEGGHFKYLDEIKRLMLNSCHKDLIKRANFDGITVKSKIAIALMKKERIKTAFYFLHGAGTIKRILKKR